MHTRLPGSVIETLGPPCASSLIDLKSCLGKTPRIVMWGIALAAITLNVVSNRTPRRECRRGERSETGVELARHVDAYAGRGDVIVLAPPRGGVGRLIGDFGQTRDADVCVLLARSYQDHR